MTKEIKKRQSLNRSKKSVLSLSEIAGKEALNSLIPGSGLIYSLSKLLLRHGKEFYRERTESRINDFHKALLEGTGEADIDSLMKASFSLEDYYSLLSRAVQDDEDSKVGIYAKIFHALIKKAIPEKYKLHFTKSIRELSYHDIQLIREIYIRAKYEFKRGPGLSKQVITFTNTDDPIKNYAIQKLTGLGFLKTTEYESIKYGEVKEKEGLIPSDLLYAIAEVIFDPEDLKPHSIGQEVWKNIPPIRILASNLEKHQRVLTLIAEALYDLNLRSVITIPKSMKYSNNGIILLVIDNQQSSQNEMAIIAEKNKHCRLVKIITSELFDNVSDDPFPDISSDVSIIFSPKNNDAIKGLKEYMSRITEGVE